MLRGVLWADRTRELTPAGDARRPARNMATRSILFAPIRVFWTTRAGPAAGRRHLPPTVHTGLRPRGPASLRPRVGGLAPGPGCRAAAVAAERGLLGAAILTLSMGTQDGEPGGPDEAPSHKTHSPECAEEARGSRRCYCPASGWFQRRPLGRRRRPPPTAGRPPRQPSTSQQARTPRRTCRAIQQGPCGTSNVFRALTSTQCCSSATARLSPKTTCPHHFLPRALDGAPVNIAVATFATPAGEPCGCGAVGGAMADHTVRKSTGIEVETQAAGAAAPAGGTAPGLAAPHPVH